MPASDNSPRRRGPGSSRPAHRLALAKAVLEQVEDELVVDDCVGIVYPDWIRAVVENNIRVRDAFAEVGLYASSCVSGYLAY